MVWSDGSDVCSGRLDVHRGGLDLHGRVGVLRLAFRDVNRASIERGRADRLRGLPVLRLSGRGGTSVRIASLQGPGVLHELAGHVERAGLTVAA